MKSTAHDSGEIKKSGQISNEKPLRALFIIKYSICFVKPFSEYSGLSFKIHIRSFPTNTLQVPKTRNI